MSFLDLDPVHRAQVLDLAIPHLGAAAVSSLALLLAPSSFIVVTPLNVKRVFIEISRNGVGPDAPTCMVLGGWGRIAHDYLEHMSKTPDGSLFAQFAAEDEWDLRGPHRGPITLARLCVTSWHAAMVRQRPRIYFTDEVPAVSYHSSRNNFDSVMHLFVRFVPKFQRDRYTAPMVNDFPCSVCV